jgi:hemerythrin
VKSLQFAARYADISGMFEWKPEYSVQIPEIDTQHQRLFELAGQLNSAMAAGKGKAVLGQMLGRLIDYTKVHFATEEKFMRQYGYPETETHRTQHEKLTAQVLEFQTQFQRGETKLTISLMSFLRNWLTQHIAGSDQRYSAFIRGKMAA